MELNRIVDMKILTKFFKGVKNLLRKWAKQKLSRQDPLQELKLKWRLKSFEARELKYLCMQDLMQRTPPNTDVLELGVGGGAGLQLLIKLCHQAQRHYIGFDTFSGS